MAPRGPDLLNILYHRLFRDKVCFRSETGTSHRHRRATCRAHHRCGKQNASREKQRSLRLSETRGSLKQITDLTRELEGSGLPDRAEVASIGCPVARPALLRILAAEAL
jgi:hypothetical protein